MRPRSAILARQSAWFSDIAIQGKPSTSLGPTADQTLSFMLYCIYNVISDLPTLRKSCTVYSSTHMDERRPPLRRHAALPQFSNGVVQCIWNRIERDDVLRE
jgi:hypothetical protein